MRFKKYLIEETKVKLTKAQADEIEAAYETKLEDGDFRLEKNFLIGDKKELKRLADLIEYDYDPSFGIEVSKARIKSMQKLKVKLQRL